MGLLDAIKSKGGEYVKKAFTKGGGYASGLKNAIYKKAVNASSSSIAAVSAITAAGAEVLYRPQTVAPLFDNSIAYVMPNLNTNIAGVLLIATGVPLLVKSAGKLSKDDIKRSAKGAYETGKGVGKRATNGVFSGAESFAKGAVGAVDKAIGTYKSGSEKLKGAYENRKQSNMRSKLINESGAYDNIRKANAELSEKSMNLEKLITSLNKNEPGKYTGKPEGTELRNLLEELKNEQKTVDGVLEKMNNSLSDFKNGKSKSIYVPKVTGGKLAGEFTEEYVMAAKKETLSGKVSELRGYVDKLNGLRSAHKDTEKKLSDRSDRQYDLSAKHKNMNLVLTELRASGNAESIKRADELEKEYHSKVFKSDISRSTYENKMRSIEKQIDEINPQAKGAEGKLKSAKEELATLEKMLTK